MKKLLYILAFICQVAFGQTVIDISPRDTVEVQSQVITGVSSIREYYNYIPYATSVSVSGTYHIDSTLTLNYTYGDRNSDSEGTSTFKWYRANDTLGTGEAAISGATSQTYTLVSADDGKWISGEITPIANRNPNTGIAVKSARDSAYSPLGPEMVLNNGFNALISGTPNDGADDNFENWAEISNGIVEQTSVSQSGYAVKMTNNGQTYTQNGVSQTITVEPSTEYQYTFYTRGDGSNTGAYRVYDATNKSNIINNVANNTGVSGTTYTLIQDDFSTPSGCIQIVIYFYASGTNPSSIYFDSASLRKK